MASPPMKKPDEACSMPYGREKVAVDLRYPLPLACCCLLPAHCSTLISFPPSKNSGKQVICFITMPHFADFQFCSPGLCKRLYLSNTYKQWLPNFGGLWTMEAKLELL